MNDHIAEIPCGAGRIGLARCPGLASRGDVAGDVERLASWGARALVTMLDHGDLRALDLGRLGGEVERRAIDWHHVPVADFGVPNAGAEARWRYSSLRLRRALASAGAIALHCHAGIGRTGTFAARLLIDCGTVPEEAVALVRRARPGAIETPRQLALVLSKQPPASLSAEPVLEERVLGSLLGGAAGDAFGYAIEFDRLPEIRRRFGERGLVDPDLDERGRLLVSDDTQMTMFTAEGLIRAHARKRERGIVSVESVLRRAYRRWYRTQTAEPVDEEGEGPAGWLVGESALHATRDPGNTCLGALRDPAGDLRARNESKGCGGVMRVAPAGLLPRVFDLEGAFRLGAEAAALTHGHPTGRLAAGAMAAIVRALVDGASYEDAAAAALKLLAAEREGEETSRAIAHALELARSPAADASDDVRRLGEGWIAEEALAVGLYAAIRGRDFADVVRIAANHDGDSDSTASIAGQLHGARHGVDRVPHAWIRRLDVLEPLVTLAVDLAALSLRDGPVLREYPPS